MTEKKEYTPFPPSQCVTLTAECATGGDGEEGVHALPAADAAQQDRHPGAPGRGSWGMGVAVAAAVAVAVMMVMMVILIMIRNR